jgi:hypothetical protein
MNVLFSTSSTSSFPPPSGFVTANSWSTAPNLAELELFEASAFSFDPSTQRFVDVVAPSKRKSSKHSSFEVSAKRPKPMVSVHMKRFASTKKKSPKLY